jgi:hypothetical protein
MSEPVGNVRRKAGLDRGRAKAIRQNGERATALRETVARLAHEDEARGRVARGRAGRIAQRLLGLTTRRHVARILDTLLT